MMMDLVVILKQILIVMEIVQQCGCAGDCAGSAFVDSCGVCSEGNSGHTADSDQDCNGDCYGDAFVDSCGVCSEGNSGHTADSDQDCNGDCFGDATVDGCEVCGGDDSSCAAPTDLSATGLRGEVALSWTANDAASSYNIYRDGELVGTTSNTTYMDPDGAGFGLGYSTVYCYTVSTNSADGVEGPLSETACAQTLPFVLAGLTVDVDPASKLIYVGMMNFWTISGYQFDVTITDGFTITGVVGGELTAQYGNGTVIGFSMDGSTIPATYPNGTMLAVLSYDSDGAYAGPLDVSVSDFVFSDENYMPINVCDTDFDPTNGCDVSWDPEDNYVEYDCAGVFGGECC